MSSGGQKLCVARGGVPENDHIQRQISQAREIEELARKNTHGIAKTENR